MTGSSPKAPIQTTVGCSCLMPRQYNVSPPQPPRPSQRGRQCHSRELGTTDSPQGALRHHGLGSKAKVAPATRGAIARGCYGGWGGQGIQVIGSPFVLSPTPGPRPRHPQGGAPHGHCASDCTGLRGGFGERADRGLRASGTSQTRGAGARADCAGQRGVPGRAWPSGEARRRALQGGRGPELIKARRREQGESRRVAVRPCSASASRR